MKRLFNTFLTALAFIVFGYFLYNYNHITDITSSLIKSTPKIIVPKKNKYANNYNYNFVEITNSYIPYSNQDIMNIFYTVLNNGYDSFTFYCPNEYKSCLKDVEAISNNQTTITNIGNFVHPYNNFSNLKVTTNSLGEVNIKVSKTYSKNIENELNNKINEILKEKTNDTMSLQDKILVLHDYIIDTTTYDIKDENINSGNAYGALIDGKAKCAGYADAMAIILSKLNVKNIKVASEEHVWNAVYLDNKWKHLDLTWDDPVVENENSLTYSIKHKFYLIDTPTLLSYDTEEHSFDTNIYYELK